MTQEKENYHIMQSLMDDAYDAWKAHDEWSIEDFWFHLDYNQKVAVYIGNLNYQVENGGFMQWHDNGYSQCMHDIQCILKEIGCDDVLSIVYEVKSVLDVLTWDEEEQEFIPGNACTVLDECDRRFYHVNDAMLAKVEQYLVKQIKKQTR